MSELGGTSISEIEGKTYYEEIDKVRTKKVSDQTESGTGVTARFDMTENECYGNINQAQVVTARAGYLMMIILTSITVALLLLGWFLFLFDFGYNHQYYVMYVTSIVVHIT